MLLAVLNSVEPMERFDRSPVPGGPVIVLILAEASLPCFIF